MLNIEISAAAQQCQTAVLWAISELIAPDPEAGSVPFNIKEANRGDMAGQGAELRVGELRRAVVYLWKPAGKAARRLVSDGALRMADRPSRA